MLAGLAHMVTLCVMQLHTVQCTFLWLLQCEAVCIVPFTLLAKFHVMLVAVAPLAWHANLAHKLSMSRGFCTLVLHSDSTVLCLSTAKLKPAKISTVCMYSDSVPYTAKLVWGQTAKFNDCQYFQLYGMYYFVEVLNGVLYTT